MEMRIYVVSTLGKAGEYSHASNVRVATEENVANSGAVIWLLFCHCKTRTQWLLSSRCGEGWPRNVLEGDRCVDRATSAETIRTLGPPNHVAESLKATAHRPIGGPSSYKPNSGGSRVFGSSLMAAPFISRTARLITDWAGDLISNR